LTSFTLSRMEGGRTVEVHGFQADLARGSEKFNGEILITRHGGYSSGRKYTFFLRGNDGAFTLLDHAATLERDKPTRVRFRNNGAPGWHIAFLELRDAKADVVMQDVPLSMRAPDVAASIAPGVDKYEATIEPLRSERRFVPIGEHVQAARYILRIPYTGPWNVTSTSFPGGRNESKRTPPGEPVDAAHHVGPMETLESLVANDEPGMAQVYWSNRGESEYATQYDGPAPDVPIHAELTLTKYAVAIDKAASGTLTVTNKLARIEGKVELYDATLKTGELTGTGLHASGATDRTLPAGIGQWRVRVTADSDSVQPSDVYLLNCAGKDGCYVAAQQEVAARGKAVVIEKPQEGAWKIVVRSRGQVSHSVTYSVHEAALIPNSTPIEQADSNHSNGATWTVALPKKQGDAQYAAFRIAGTPGNEREKNGLLIAMTPLDDDAP